MSDPTQHASAGLQADAIETLDTMIASITAMSTDEAVDEVVRSLLMTPLRPRARLQREAALKKALGVPAAVFNKMMIMSKRAIAEEAEAPVRDLQIDLDSLERQLEATLASIKAAKREVAAHRSGNS